MSEYKKQQVAIEEIKREYIQALFDAGVQTGQAHARIADLKEEVYRRDSDLEGANERIADLMAELKAAQETSEDAIDLPWPKIVTLSNRIDELEGDALNLEDERNDMLARRNEWVTRYGRLETTYAELSRGYLNMREVRDEALAELKETQEERDEVTQRAEDLMAEYSGVHDKYQMSDYNLARAREKIEAYELDDTMKQNIIANLEATLKESQHELEISREGWDRDLGLLEKTMTEYNDMTIDLGKAIRRANKVSEQLKHARELIAELEIPVDALHEATGGPESRYEGDV